jgi:hypothetical protein
VRIIHNWDLMLVEQALAICLWYADSPALGYKLAADYCQHYDCGCTQTIQRTKRRAHRGQPMPPLSIGPGTSP